ncbi:MAG: terminase small subunit [Lachnospiraceae bacterium]|nr:terminase small subunit [Lachnospiraceae bacterium]
MALTKSQKKFVNEYLKDLNATRAYKTAYPSVKRNETAAAAGARMLRNVKVQEEIEKRIKDREKRTEITQDMVIKELAAIAFSNASNFAKVIERQAVIVTEDGNRTLIFDDKGKPLMIKDVELALTDELTEEQQKAISSIKHGKHGIEVSTCDKVRALELLGRHLGMFKDKVEVTGLQDEMSKLDDILKQMEE